MKKQDIFKTDWFVRSDNFTVKNEENQIGWDSMKDEYSKWLYSATDVSEMLSDKEELRNKMETLANTVSEQNVNVIITNETNSGKTNGKSIMIGKNLTMDFKSDYDKLDTFMGLIIHECCHCKYTDFSVLKNALNQNTYENKIIHYISNIIEDECIEEKLGNEKPGFSNYIAKVKYKFFDKEKFDYTKAINKADFILAMLLYIVRYPSYFSTIPNDIKNEYKDLFYRIYNIFVKHGVITGVQKNITKSSIAAAKEIYELIEKYIDKNDDEDGEEENENGNETYETDKKGNQQIGGGNGNGGKEQLDQISNDKNSLLNKVINELNKILSESELGNTSDDIEEIKENIKKLNNEFDIIEKVYEKQNIGDKTYKRDSIGKTYNEYYNEVKKYIHFIKNITYSKTKTIKYEDEKYTRSGRLDPSRLALAMQNNILVYKRMNAKIVPNNKYAMVIMIDESGSMENYNCFNNASKLSILFAEALKNNPDIELYIYGHGDYINCYLDKNHKDITVLGSRVSQCCQNECVSYKKILDDVRLQTKLPILAINITDSLYGSDAYAIKNVVDEYAKDNIVINLIELDTKSSYGYKTKNLNETIYGKNNYFVLKNENMDSLKDLAKVIANNIKNRLKR